MSGDGPINDALNVLVAQHRSAELDAAYTAAHAEHSMDEPDEWGELASFRHAVSQ